MRIVARIFPSGPSSACPTFPRPRIRPSVTPFCLSRPGISAAVSLTALPSCPISGFASRPPTAQLTGVLGRLSSSFRIPDRIPKKGSRLGSDEELPFAPRAAPLVADRAPLVVLVLRTHLHSAQVGTHR